jgi:hypothetical protein
MSTASELSAHQKSANFRKETFFKLLLGKKTVLFYLALMPNVAANSDRIYDSFLLR